LYVCTVNAIPTNTLSNFTGLLSGSGFRFQGLGFRDGSAVPRRARI